MRGQWPFLSARNEQVSGPVALKVEKGRVGPVFPCRPDANPM